MWSLCSGFRNRRKTPRKFRRRAVPQALLAEQCEVRVMPSSATFAVIGDYGYSPSTGNQAELNVSNLVHSWNPNFIATAGDNNYPNGDSSTIDADVGQYYHDYIYPYKGTYGAGATSNKFWPTLGGHDWLTPNAQPYLNYFTLPGNGHYYTQTIGPVELFAVDGDSLEPDGYTNPSVQAQWLQSQLQASTASWKIVLEHFAPYSSGGVHGSQTYMEWPFQAWGATTVISGGDHDYERLLEDNNFPYFVDGTGGNGLYNEGNVVPGSQVFYNAEYGAMKIQATDTQITFQFVNTDGTVIDNYSISLTAPAAPTNLTATGGGTDQLNLTWANNSLNETGFNIQRSTDGTNYTQVASVGPNVTTYNDTGLTPGVTYYYRVDAYNAGGTSAYSNVASNVPGGVATHLGISAPTPVAVGTSFSVTVTALDTHGVTASGYLGTVHFTSSDPAAALPADYTFVSSDLGAHTFTATLNTPGTQSLTATDTVTSSITGTQSGISVTGHATYYVSPTGSDSNPGTLASPFRTINHGVGVLHAGDIVYVRAGTYAESLINVIPSGTSWGVPVTVSAYPGESVTLQPASGQFVIEILGSSHYIVINGLNLDGTHITRSAFLIQYSTGGIFPDHILFENAEVKNAPSQGVQVPAQNSAASTYDQFINLNVHNNTNGGIFISGNNILVDHCQSYQNGSYGIQIYQSGGTNPLVASNNTVRYNKVHDDGSVGIGIYTGDSNVAFDNLIWNNGIGISVEAGATHTLVYNNTLYQNTGDGGIRVGYTSPASSGTVIKNDLFNNNHRTIFDFESGLTEDSNLLDTAVVLGGSGSLASGSGAHDVSSTTPRFVNASGFDFHLQSTSPAIGKGVTLSLVPNDFDGVPRPQGPAYAIGAYEYPAGVPSTLIVSGFPSSVTAGTAGSFTLTAKDIYGNTTAGYKGTIHFTSSDSQAALPADYTFTTADQGQHTFTVTLKSAGTQSLTATDTQTGSITGSQSGITVNPTAASTFGVSGPTSATAGTAFSVTVTAKDPYGNTATGYSGTVAFSSSDLQADLPANAGLSNGVGAFTFTLETAGNQSLTATDTVTSSISGSQSGIAVSPAAAAIFAVEQVPEASAVTAGTALTFEVDARDAFGNIAAGYAGTVHFTSSDAQAVLPANYTYTTADQGVHVFTNGVTLKTVGMQSVTVADTVSGSITGGLGGISVSAAAASTLTVSAATSTTAGTAFSVTVTAKDPYGNTATGYAGTVHFTSSDAQAALPADYAFVGADAGSHTFTSGVTLKTAGSQSLTATDTVTGSITGSQSGITVSAASASTLSVSAPASATAGAAFSVTILAKDLYGNTAIGYTGTISFTSSDAQAALPTNYTFTGADAGSHTFTSGVTLKTIGTQSLTATDTQTGSITGTQSGIAVSAGAASTLTVSAATSATAGTAFSVTVAAKDPYGNTATGYTGTVHFTSSDVQAVLPANYTFTAADAGSHTFTSGVTLKTAGSQSLTATDTVAGSITGSQSGITVNAASASTLIVSAASSATAGTALTVTVTAKDTYGNTATGYTGTVHFTSSDAQATLPADGGLSSGVGAFSVTFKTAGNQSVTATDTVNSLITGSQAGITVNPAGASTLTVSGFPASATAGTAGSITVLAKDAYGNTATGYTGTVHFTSTDAQAGLPVNYTFVGADAGSHTFTNGVTLKTAGSQSVTASDTLTGSITGSQSGITISASAASTLAVSAPASVTAGTAFSVTVAAKDPYGNSATSYAGTISFTSSDAQAVLPANYTFTGADVGSHTFTSAVTFKTAGSQSLTATDTLTGSITGSQSGISVGAAAASTLTVSAPASNPAGAAFSVTVTAKDTYGNTATGYTGTVHFTSSDSQATLPANYTFTGADAGSHTFTNGVTLNSTGSQTVTATDTQTGSITGTATVTVTAATATHFTVSGPSSASAGAAFSITVTALDAFNNTATNYRGTVHFTSTDSQAGLPADYTFTATDQGVHTFTNAVTLKTAGSQSLTATDTQTGSITGTLSGISVSGAAAATLTVSAPASVTAGTAFSVTVTANDPYGNTATGYTGTVHFTSSDTLAALPANYTFTGADAGSHTFTNSVTLKTGGSQSLTATDTLTGTITGTQSGISVNGAAASTLTVTGFSSPATAGTAGTLTVTAKDAYGNTATGYTGTVHFTSSDTQAALPANYTFVAADQGAHTFSATLKTVGSQSITASDSVTGSITGSQSGITVNPAGASTFTVTGFSSPITAGTAGTVSVTAKDAYGNTATGYTGTVHFSSSDAQAALPANYTFVAADQGAHSFSATLKTVGSQSLTASDTVTGSITGSQSSITVNPAGASTFTVAGFSSPTTAGTAGTFTVTAKDAYGNTATGYTGTVHFTSSDAQAALPANYTFVAADQGAHTFSATLKTVGSQSLTASDTLTGSITGSQSGITINPAAATTLTVSGFPSPSTAGVAGIVTVTANDAYGNTATGYTGTVHFTSSDAQAALPANYTFVAADQGAHTFSATLKTVGSQSLTASDTVTGSITGGQSGITVNPAGASTFTVAGFSSPITAGTAGTFTVTAKDAYGNTATGYTGTAHFTSSDAQAALPANYTFVAADQGSHTFSATLKTVGSQSLTASDSVTGSITGSQSGITVNPAGASALTVSGFPSPSTAGVAGTFTVTAKDAYGNTATGYTGTVTFTSSDAQAALPVNYTFVAADQGAHSFSATLKTVGSQSLTASDTVTGSITGSQSGITVNPAGASTLTVSGPSSASAGSAFNITVTAKDAYGNTATGYTGTVHFTSSDSAATLPANYTFVAADQGAHTFSVTLNTVGSQSVTAADTVTSSITGTLSGITVSGASYYVSTTGSDSNPGTISAPFRTINHGVSILHPGYILYVRAGTYAESLINVIPSGTSWSIPVTVAAYPGESVALQPASGAQYVIEILGSSSYIDVNGLNLDGTNISASAFYITKNTSGVFPDHIKFENAEVKNAPAQGVFVSGTTTASSTYDQFLHLTVHNNGSGNGSHGMYISGSHILIAHCESYSNGGEGIQIYMASGINPSVASYNTVSYCKLHDNGTFGASANIGLGIYTGDGNVAFNDLIWNNAIGISVERGATNTLIYNNTIYHNTGDGGMRIGYSSPASSGTIIKNDLFNSNSKTIFDFEAGLTEDYNLLDTSVVLGRGGSLSSGSGAHDVSSSNPMFVNASGHDFHLQAGSPAIDKGVTLTLVPDDFDGVLRPQGTAYDIGAYEYRSGSSPLVLSGASSPLLSATGTVNGSINTRAVSPATANILVVSGLPAVMTGGTAGSTMVTAKVPYGNAPTGYTGMVHLGSSTRQTHVPAFVTADQGAHSFGGTPKTIRSTDLKALCAVMTEWNWTGADYLS
jgi:hypothetical protein